MLRPSEIASWICLFSALFTFFGLPGLHVLLHEREAAKLEQARALFAARALHHARHAHPHDAAGQAADHAADHAADYDADHDLGSDLHPHSHSHDPGDGSQHGRDAPEHLACALSLTAPPPLPPPSSLIELLPPGRPSARAAAAPRLRANATRGPPVLLALR